MIKKVFSFCGATYAEAQVAMERAMCRRQREADFVSWQSDPPFMGEDGRWHVDAYATFRQAAA